MPMVQNTPYALTHNFFTLAYTEKEESVFLRFMITNSAQITTCWLNISGKDGMDLKAIAEKNGNHFNFET